MVDYHDIENIINILDEKTVSGVGRIKINVVDTQESGEVREQYHLGRCDVGSPWATGKTEGLDKDV